MEDTVEGVTEGVEVRCLYMMPLWDLTTTYTIGFRHI
jgi:hypothetical protein